MLSTISEIDDEVVVVVVVVSLKLAIQNTTLISIPQTWPTC
jgi:hypothetical protein